MTACNFLIKKKEKNARQLWPYLNNIVEIALEMGGREKKIEGLQCEGKQVSSRKAFPEKRKKKKGELHLSHFEKSVELRGKN